MPDHEQQLSDDELLKIRRILLTHERTQWLWATIAVWAKWTAAVLIAGGLLVTFARDGLRALIGGGHP